jgi:hypothetical protein
LFGFNALKLILANTWLALAFPFCSNLSDNRSLKNLIASTFESEGQTFRALVACAKYLLRYLKVDFNGADGVCAKPQARFNVFGVLILSKS